MGIAGQRCLLSFSLAEGPRVWYGPYQTISREMFAHLHRLLAEERGGFILERLSIDEARDASASDALAPYSPHRVLGFAEAFLDASEAVAGADRFAQAKSLAQKLVAELQATIGVRVSVGIAPNRLLAKLGSIAAKPPRGDGICIVEGPDSCASPAAERLLT